MNQTFEFMRVASALDSYTIDDIGNTILLANNDNGFEWVLYIKTDLGFTLIKEFGPLAPSQTITKLGFNYNITKLEYNESRIGKIIDKFLNNPYREITQVQEIDLIDFKDKTEAAEELMKINEI